MSKDSHTRSGLLWEVERILEECNGNLPQVLLMENVPLVIGKKNIKDFDLWRKKLASLGYSNYAKLLNSKNYGIPQNRNRCFMVSILGDYYYEFPKKQKLALKLKDLLENKVNEKYYLSEQRINYITNIKNENLKKIKKGSVAIRNNNNKGYLIADKGDGIDISSRMKTHRGTVQKGLSQTLDTQCNVGIIDE
jgi:DNA (cytosine-5)-methyltransferase 1